MARLALAANFICLHVHAATQPWRHPQGFVRQPRSSPVPVGAITAEMLAAVPAKLDWTETSGAVSAVRDEGRCGSTWAISAVDGIESGFFQSTGSPSPSLSPQQIVDCDKKDSGCNGGYLTTALDYVESVGGLDTEQDYPYTSSDGEWGDCKNSTPVVTVTDYKYAITPCLSGSCSSQDEEELKAALASHGPLSVCLYAGLWNFYDEGVFSMDCSSASDRVDHCAQLVGFDTTASTPFWRIKNQWGTSWGENGFIRLPMGVNACGLANEAMYVKASLASAVI